MKSGNALFQFLMVQLKVLLGLQHYLKTHVSIPYGTIKSFFLHSIQRPHDTFQFLMVQLKAQGQPFDLDLKTCFNSLWYN